MQETATKRLLSVREVAQKFGVIPRTVWRWVSEGRIPKPIHITNRTVRWDSQEIEAYIHTLKI